MQELLKQWWLVLVASAIAFPLAPGVTLAHDASSQFGMPCPMCGMMTGTLHWLAATLSVSLSVAIIAVLVALAAYLVRRSRDSSGTPIA